MMSTTDGECVKSPVVKRRLGADLHSTSSVGMAMSELRYLSFERQRALAAPISILGWVCTSIGPLQTYYAKCLSVIKPIHETDSEEDGIAQLLANGRNKWWNHDLNQWLDALVRRDIKECSTILETFGKLLMDVYNESQDYAQGRGILDLSPYEPVVEDEDEMEEWITEYQERITKAKEMETKLLNAFLIAQDNLTSVRDHTDRQRAESWMGRLALTETPPPEAAIVRGDYEGYLRRLSEPQDGDVRPMNTALDELRMVGGRVGRKLDEHISKAQTRLEKGRYRTLVDTLFLSEEEDMTFRMGVAERVARVVRSHPPSVVEARLIKEIRSTIYEVTGAPVWMIMSLFEQCTDSAFGSSMELEQATGGDARIDRS